MTEAFLAAEPWVRLTAFLGGFAAFAVAETLAPRRRRALPRAARWPSNLGVVVLNSVLVRFAVPAGAVGAAAAAQANGWGILNVVPLDGALAVVIAVVALDLAVWAQHVAFHKVPWLWRLHRMHHADQDFDVTTGLRFHPGEILTSMLVKSAVVVALGAPPVAVLIFEIVLNATSMFTHADVKLPERLDRWLRLVVVTPDMHRVHHSVHRDETDSNYGFNLSIWDRLFRVYRAQPRDGYEAMTMGLPVFRTRIDQRLDRMLLQPFRRP